MWTWDYEVGMELIQNVTGRGSVWTLSSPLMGRSPVASGWSLAGYQQVDLHLNIDHDLNINILYLVNVFSLWTSRLVWHWVRWNVQIFSISSAREPHNLSCCTRMLKPVKKKKKKMIILLERVSLQVKNVKMLVWNISGIYAYEEMKLNANSRRHE